MREGDRVRVTIPGSNGYPDVVHEGVLVNHCCGLCIVDIGGAGYVQYRDRFVTKADDIVPQLAAPQGDGPCAA